MPTTKALILAFTFLFYITGTTSTNFTIQNNCPYTIWPATKTDSGYPLSSTGFTLNPGASSTLLVQPFWFGSIWARTHCTHDPTTQKFVCATGDCASGQVSCNLAGPILPATLVQFGTQWVGQLDYYNVSLVDGYNLPVTVAPTAPKSTCKSLSCSNDVNKFCPPELAVKDQSGNVIACKSACLAFNQPQYCCTGAYNSTCPPTTYSQVFKEHCPQAFSYVYDNQTSTTCPEESTDYVITFCP